MITEISCKFIFTKIQTPVQPQATEKATFYNKPARGLIQVNDIRFRVHMANTSRGETTRRNQMPP